MGGRGGGGRPNKSRARFNLACGGCRVHPLLCSGETPRWKRRECLAFAITGAGGRLAVYTPVHIKSLISWHDLYGGERFI